MKIKAIILIILPVITIISPGAMAQTYDYLPGDANMAYSEWPPVVDVNDATYLVSYFRSLTISCEIEGFYAAADVNSSCTVTASDVTYLINYLRGFVSDLSYCESYPSSWPTSDDLPDTMPSPWPPCSSIPHNPPPDEVSVWFGSLDGSPVEARIGDTVEIDVFIQTTDSCYLSNMEMHIGADSQYISSFDSSGHQLYSPLNQWDFTGFSGFYGSPPNPAGWHSQSFLGIAEMFSPFTGPWLHSTSPVLIMTIALQISADPSNEGDTVFCLDEGEHPDGRPFSFGDTLGIYNYPYQLFFSPLYFVGQQLGSIEGVVQNQASDPIEGVQVTSIGATIVTDYTDAYGNYSLPDLTPGTYDVDFSHPDYIDTVVTSVLVEQGMVTPLNVTMNYEFEREPGWLYTRPRTIRDTINANAMAWVEVQLIDYDSVYSITIDSIKTSDTWIIIDNWSGVAIPSLDSMTLPVTFDMTGHSNEANYGEITIWHSGPDTSNVVGCEIRVTGEPSTGALISANPDTFYLNVEPDVEGELAIRVSNSGDLPLIIYGTTNTSDWLTPVIDTGTVTPLEPLDLIFNINTTDYEDIVLADVLTISSNAVNNSSLPINFTVTVAPDSMAGTNSLGDVNYDGWCNENDVFYLIDYFYGIGPEPCMPAGDINGDYALNTLDVVYLINYLRGSGSPPVNSCDSVYNYVQHNAGLEAQIGPFITGHRNEWISVPVSVQDSIHYKTQLSFDIPLGIIDDIIIDDVTGLGYEAYAHVDTNLTLDLSTIVISDTVGPSAAVSFGSLTQVYDLQIHISDDAPIGKHSIAPSPLASERGPTIFLLDDNSTSLAPLFLGSSITIMPTVTLEEIIGVPEIALVTELRNFPLSSSITSDAIISNMMQIFIIQLSSGDTVHADTVSQSLLVGTHTYDFTVDWEVETTGLYLVGAAIISELDETGDNHLGKYVYLTDNIQNGLPPAEGFGGGDLIRIPSTDQPPTITDLPVNFISRNEDAESPEWDIYTGMSYDPDNNRCVHMPGYNCLGPHDDWLIFGPMTGVSIEEPTIRFWETAFNWNDTSGSSHEYYIQYSNDFDIATALADGPILTHTPDNHGITPLIWLSVSIDLPDSIGINDKVYFAWRYVGPEEQACRRFDTWRVDYIEWFGAPSGDLEYVPGDANMYNGIWPPEIIGADVTYLVNYFRGIAAACNKAGFFCSADVNGTCEIIGSDVTRLVNYFRGAAAIEYCADYPPLWLTPADAAGDPMPSGWPNCGIPPLMLNETGNRFPVNNINESKSETRTKAE